MDRVIVESPYAGDVETNLNYLMVALRDCLMRGEAPFASHGLYTREGVLNDDISGERTKGILAGFEWMKVADKVVVYTDLGITKGMKGGITKAEKMGIPVEYRNFEGNEDE